MRGASALALRLGLTPLVIGLTVVAFGTSAPELVVSVGAAVTGAHDIAIGNVVGSNIANLTLILGGAMLVGPALVQARTVRIDAPLIVLVSLGLVALLADQAVSRLDGMILLTGLVGFTGLTLVQGRREPPVVRHEYEEALEQVPMPLGRSLVFVVGGLAALVAGGRLFVTAAIELARIVGLSEAVIGLTIVAIGTSMPELVTSIVAALRAQGDIAVGNVLGSNLFNVLGILGVSAAVAPMRSGGVAWANLWVMVATAALVLALGVAGSRFSRRDGAILLASYALYVGWLLNGSA